jgi:uncharacterized coiled-coil DUF342 family protein
MGDEPDNPILAALARLEAGQATLQQSVAALATRAELAQVRVELTEVRAELTQSVAALATRTELTQVRAELTQMRVDLMARMDRLEDGLTAIRNDIAVNFGAADVVKRANDNTREEVRSLGEMVSALVRKVRALETRVREIAGDP